MDLIYFPILVFSLRSNVFIAVALFNILFLNVEETSSTRGKFASSSYTATLPVPLATA